jgi:hypothetical protein
MPHHASAQLRRRLTRKDMTQRAFAALHEVLGVGAVGEDTSPKP